MTSQTTPSATSTASPDVKAKHRAMWALGDYPSVAADVIPALGPRLVEACGVTAGQRVLDVAAGSGNAAVPAARAGAEVVASDLTPELLDAGRRHAETLGLRLDWREADAEALPFGDGAFDVVMSCVGAMFAPFHQTTADELIRVCRPAGTIGLISWTPAGFIGQMFATMKPYAPPPPPGAQPPPLWGDEAHVRSLLRDRVSDVSARTETLRVDCFDGAEEFRDFFKACYGPTIAVYRAIADEPAKVETLDRELVELAQRHDLGDGVMEWEYLLFTARCGQAPPS
ncbi:class I SAM-dependent methyltransferase [Nocardioides pacificus]